MSTLLESENLRLIATYVFGNAVKHWKAVTFVLLGFITANSSAGINPEPGTLTVLEDGQIASTWNTGIAAWDQAIGYQLCINDGGAACPTVGWRWVNTTTRGPVLRGDWVANGNSAGIFFEATPALDLSRFAGGTIEFDIRAPVGTANVVMKIDCIFPCASAEWRSSQSINSVWQRIVVPIDRLVGSGLDLSKVSTGLVFWPAPGHAGVSFEIDNVLWRSGTSDPTQTAEAFQGTGGAELNLDGLNGAANMSPDSYPGMTLAWSDEFDTNTLNEQLWSHDTGGWGWGNNESQYYRSENTTIQDGHLVITAKKELYSGREYTSSRIKTEGKQSFTYGRVDIRAALPRGQGIWPALWALGSNFSDVGWPYSGEIDIMEMIGGSGRESEIHGTVHWNIGGLDAPYNHTYIGGKTVKASGNFGDGFNVFSIVRSQDRIEWLVNDQPYYEFSIDDSPDLAPFRQPFFLIFNVAVGGNWPGYPDSSTSFPQRLVVDYVRVFSASNSQPTTPDEDGSGDASGTDTDTNPAGTDQDSNGVVDETGLGADTNQDTSSEQPIDEAINSQEGDTADELNELASNRLNIILLYLASVRGADDVQAKAELAATAADATQQGNSAEQDVTTAMSPPD